METFDTKDVLALPDLNAMTYFAIAATAISVIVLWVIAVRKIHWYSRPSLLLFAMFLFHVQWSSIFVMKHASEICPIPWHYGVIIHGFALCFWIAAIPLYVMNDRYTLAIWNRMREQIDAKQTLPPRVIILLTILIAGIMAWYFMVLPFSETGLYAMFTDPLNMNFAREVSVKLLPNTAVRYLFTWNRNTFTPLLVIAATSLWIMRRRWHYILPAITGVLSTLMAVNRSSFAFPVLLIVLTYYLIRTRNPRLYNFFPFLLIGGTLVLLGPTVVTIIREGREVTTSTVTNSLTGGIMERLMFTPAFTAEMHVYYGQMNPQVGVASIRPLAAVNNREYVEVANEIGAKYYRGGKATTLCNTNYVAAYYVALGLWTIPFCIVGVLLFDLLLMTFHLCDTPILPFFILFITKSLSGSEDALTSIFLTGGYWLIPIFAMLARTTGNYTSQKMHATKYRPKYAPPASRRRTSG